MRSLLGLRTREAMSWQQLQYAESVFYYTYCYRPNAVSVPRYLTYLVDLCYCSVRGRVKA